MCIQLNECGFFFSSWNRFFFVSLGRIQSEIKTFACTHTCKRIQNDYRLYVIWAFEIHLAFRFIANSMMSIAYLCRGIFQKARTHTYGRHNTLSLSLSVYRVYRVSWNWKALLCSTEFLCQFDFVPHKHQFGLMCCCFTDGLLVIALYLPWFGLVLVGYGTVQ